MSGRPAGVGLVAFPGFFRSDALTPKNIPNRERLIFAMDVADPQAARQLVEQLGDAVVFYKIGLELFMSGGYFELLDWMVVRGKKIFVDLKFFDVPATVAAAVKQLRNRGVTFATIHGNQAIMEAAAVAKGDVKILAVTVLTSLDEADLRAVGLEGTPGSAVERLARLAASAGLDGVVCSAQEAPALRSAFGREFKLVTPGIRPAGSAKDDQTRIVTPAAALSAGADYLVIGRPITQAPDPLAALAAINASLA